MSRLMEEPQQHIHDSLVSELNEMSIRIKLRTQTIMPSPKYRNAPTWEEVLNLIDRCRDEMNQCTKPYKIHQHDR